MLTRSVAFWTLEKTFYYAKLDKSQIHVLILMETSARLRQRKTIDKNISLSAVIVYDTSVQVVILSRDKSDDVQALLLFNITIFSIGIETPGRVTISMIKHIISRPTSRHTPSLLNQTTSSVHLF
ncbi:hypothetical protein HPG69_007839 [Diceros bicornis minor]|uniref:Uncharacterized protein n=1 Tax=Diceros bicornis minor TaxID=77932 RepID=A0A7J7EBR3_DICBM|nr:hypothetical protein HPG69_007839 [Diceros bicornis minor]